MKTKKPKNSKKNLEVPCDQFECRCGEPFTLNSKYLKHKEKCRRVLSERVRYLDLGLYNYFCAKKMKGFKVEDFKQFSESRWYKAFHKAARLPIFSVDINDAEYARAFCDYLIENDIRIHDCDSDIAVKGFVQKMYRTQTLEEALARTVKILQDFQLSKEHLVGCNHAFMSHMVELNLISPWFLLCCSFMDELIMSMSYSELKAISDIISTPFWSMAAQLNKKKIKEQMKLLKKQGY